MSHHHIVINIRNRGVRVVVSKGCKPWYPLLVVFEKTIPDLWEKLFRAH